MQILMLKNLTGAEFKSDPMNMEMLELLQTGMANRCEQPSIPATVPKDPDECIPCENEEPRKVKDNFFTPKPSSDDFFKM